MPQPSIAINRPPIDSGTRCPCTGERNIQLSQPTLWVPQFQDEPHPTLGVGHHLRYLCITLCTINDHFVRATASAQMSGYTPPEAKPRPHVSSGRRRPMQVQHARLCGSAKRLLYVSALSSSSTGAQSPCGNHRQPVAKSASMTQPHTHTVQWLNKQAQNWRCRLGAVRSR